MSDETPEWPDHLVKLPPGEWRFDPFTRVRRYAAEQPIDRNDYEWAPQPCGTSAAYDRHRYHGEDPCDACTEAKREDKRAYRRAKAHRDAA